MYELYYLVDQNGDINGDKVPQGYFSTLADAQAKAANDGIAHYSVELERIECVSIVYII